MTAKTDTELPIATKQAARLVDLGERYMTQLAQRNQIPHFFDGSGRRLFWPKELREWKKQRDAKRGK